MLKLLLTIIGVGLTPSFLLGLVAGGPIAVYGGSISLIAVVCLFSIDRRHRSMKQVSKEDRERALEAYVREVKD